MNLQEAGSPTEISPRELCSLLAEEHAPVVLDCREDNEIAICMLPASVHIPMQQIPQRLAELSPDADTVVICHHGVRSMRVALWLAQQAGFRCVKSLRGGIDAWSQQIDPEVPRY